MNYERIYNQIIERAKNEEYIRAKQRKTKERYFEGHHIIPVCLGGSNDKSNIAILTSREHFLCHWILIRMYPESIKLSHAFYRMCAMQNTDRYNNDVYRPSGRMYAEAKEAWISYLRVQMTNRTFSEESKRKLSETRLKKFKNGELRVWNKGMKLGPLSEEHKAKVRQSLKGRPGPNRGKKMSEEQRKKISASSKRVGPNKGKVMSALMKKRLSEANKGRVYRKENCNFCHREYPINTIKRHSKICQNNLNN